ncbi:MAG: hypothetical protein ACSLEN_03355 [Candidatus Malihini olakiniferum]
MQAWWRQDDTQRQLADITCRSWVDYSAVMAQKLVALRLAYNYFKMRSVLDPRFSAFR